MGWAAVLRTLTVTVISRVRSSSPVKMLEYTGRYSACPRLSCDAIAPGLGAAVGMSGASSTGDVGCRTRGASRPGRSGVSHPSPSIPTSIQAAADRLMLRVGLGDRPAASSVEPGIGVGMRLRFGRASGSPSRAARRHPRGDRPPRSRARGLRALGCRRRRIGGGRRRRAARVPRRTSAPASTDCGRSELDVSGVITTGG
jgi:hypothetical protein